MTDSDPITRLNAALQGRYRIESELGEGGMATVYLAEDIKHARKVALKVLKPELAAVVGAERFLAEIKTTANLQHPHILPLFDSGEADGFLFYVMPYVEGETLRERIDREKQLPVDEAVAITTAVAHALQHAHDRGVIHRDIKPGNILIQDGEPVLADFGIALVVRSTDTSRLTETGMSVGTPEYMSPEQALGEAELGPGSDIYMLACVLYEMLTGEPPHTGATIQSVIAKLLTQEPTHPRTLRTTVSEALDAAVMKGLAKLPADRFASAERLAQVLNEVRDAPASAASAPAPRRSKPVECAYKLKADTCRELDRADLDPRMIGDHLHYLDNQVESDVLVCYVHGFGADHRLFQEILETSPNRGVALSLYGFEPKAERRASLSLESHRVLVRHFLADTVAALAPATTILVGFSSGADFLFGLLESWPPESSVEVDAFLALGCNLSLNTCFVSRVLARQTSDTGDEILPDLRASGAGAASLAEWLNLHEYLVTMLRKFQSDLRPLRRHGQDIVRPFEAGDSPFPRWFQAASGHVDILRCVFADTEMEAEAVQQLLFDHLDSGVLGEHYSEESIQIEPGADHFDLIAPERANRHVAEIVAHLRGVEVAGW